jgi:glycosyltransferase involved in cell wall biosynthesis
MRLDRQEPGEGLLMRILHVTPYFPPATHYGGVPEAVYALAVAQARRGHRVCVATTDAGIHPEDGTALHWEQTPPLQARTAFEGCDIYYYRNRMAFMLPLKVFTPHFEGPEFEALLDNCDVLHVHEVHIPGYASLARQAMERQIAVAVSAHGSLKPPVMKGWKKAAHALVDPILRRNWFTLAHRHFSLSRHESGQLSACHVPAERISVIPHGLPVFSSKEETLPFEIVPSPHVTFLYVGRISALKGIFTALEAFKQCWQEGLRSRLLICGPDEGCVESVQIHSESKNIPFHFNTAFDEAGVTVYPPCAHAALPGLFSAADWTLCPSPYESFGLVVPESLLCHVPVIATEAYGCLEHIAVPERQLIRVAPHAVKPLVNAMKQAIQGGKTKKPCIELESILPSWDEIAKKYCDEYQK